MENSFLSSVSDLKMTESKMLAILDLYFNIKILGEYNVI